MRFQYWLWRVIDHTHSPELLWHKQELGYLLRLIRRNKPEDYKRIMDTYFDMNDFSAMHDHDEIHRAILHSCHGGKYHREYC